MNTLEIPFDEKFIANVAKKYPTPYYVYDEAGLRANSTKLSDAMHSGGFKNFRNYFAVKALPNPHILKILVDEGQGLDCSSLAELELAHMVGVRGSDIMFTSNNTSQKEYERAMEFGAIINFDDVSHIEPFLKTFGAPKVACCRYNPGDITLQGGESWIIGKPSEAKYGMPKKDILNAYSMLKDAGVKAFGLHTMLLSNDRDWRTHISIAKIMFNLASELTTVLKLNFDFINLGGGIGVNYDPDDAAFDLKKYTQKLRVAYDDANMRNIGSPNIIMENGRYISADCGYLVAKVINRKETHRTYVGLDASMSNLMRPGMYDAYHHITNISNLSGSEEVVDITGALCENNDKFAIQRQLPHSSVGDYFVIHTTGAHGHAMGFQYNGKLRSSELLLKADGDVEQIRRAETLDDYFATLHGNDVTKLRKD